MARRTNETPRPLDICLGVRLWRKKQRPKDVSWFALQSHSTGWLLELFKPGISFSKVSQKNNEKMNNICVQHPNCKNLQAVFKCSVRKFNKRDRRQPTKSSVSLSLIQFHFFIGGKFEFQKLYHILKCYVQHSMWKTVRYAMVSELSRKNIGPPNLFFIENLDAGGSFPFALRKVYFY